MNRLAPSALVALLLALRAPARSATPLRHTAPIDMSTANAIALDVDVPWGDDGRVVAARLTGQVDLFDIAVIGASLGMAWGDHDGDQPYTQRPGEVFGPSNLALHARGAWCVDVGWTICVGGSFEAGVDTLREDTDREPSCGARGLAYAADGRQVRYGVSSLWVIEPWPVLNAAGDGFFLQVAGGPIFGQHFDPLWGVHANVAWRPLEWGALSLGVRAASLIGWGDEANVCYDGLWPYGDWDETSHLVHLDVQLRAFLGRTTAFVQLSVPFFSGEIVGGFDDDSYTMALSFGARQEF